MTYAQVDRNKKTRTLQSGTGKTNFDLEIASIDTDRLGANSKHYCYHDNVNREVNATRKEFRKYTFPEIAKIDRYLQNIYHESFDASM